MAEEVHPLVPCEGTPAILARHFAKDTAERIRKNWKDGAQSWLKNAPNQSPQSFFRSRLEGLCRQFEKDWSQELASIKLDCEGDSDRHGCQPRSYWLFGTMAHPDAAVSSPFRCAIEFDRQPSGDGTNWSGFKQRLGKTLFHVLSGAYDAAIQVYVLTDEKQSPYDYWTNDRGNQGWERLYSLATLERLDSLGVHVAVISGY